MSKAGGQKRLWQRLWAWAFGAVLLVWVTLVGVAYYTGLHEADEISDGQLQSVAELMLRLGAEGHVERVIEPKSDAARDAYAPELAVLLWEGDRLLQDSHGWAAAWTQRGEPGFSFWTPRGGQGPWRVWVQSAGARHVVVLTPMAPRVDLGSDLAVHIVRPALVVLPLVAFGLVVALKRGVRPITDLAAEVAQLDVHGGQGSVHPQPFAELMGTVHAINTLIASLQAQVQRERAFAADVAHELRTPLSALVWQARLARSTPDPQEQTGALQKLEAEALRAGHILTQLLDLARAQGVASRPLQSLELRAWVAHQLALLAPQPHAASHELALVATEAAMPVLAQPLMLELALRNLLDNALRHTPAGTRVWVELQLLAQGEVVLAVCDDGQNHLTTPTGAPSAGLGLGLTLVKRLADGQGLSFFKDPAPPPGVSRFVLQWPAAGQEGPVRL